jgi:hypothetical protein
MDTINLAYVGRGPREELVAELGVPATFTAADFHRTRSTALDGAKTHV